MKYSLIRLLPAGLMLLSALTSVNIQSRASSCVPPPAGLVGWWKGEDNGNDSAGTNNATVLAGVAYVPAEVGQGFSLAGQFNGILAPDAPSLDFSSNQDFSIEAWIQPLASPGNFNDSMVIIDKRIAPDTVTQLGYSLFVSDGVLGFQMADVLAPGSWNNFSGGPDLRDGHFHHVAVSVQRNSTSGGQLYVDGNLVSTFDPTVCPGDLSNTGPFRIGNFAVPGTPANFFGIIDEVSLYNRALTATEIQAIFNAGSGGKCVEATPPPPITNCVPPPAGLVGWWKGEDNGNDSAGTNNAAVLAGVAYAPAEVGQGFSLAGQANGINAPDAPALDFSSNQDFSIEAWIQPLASPGNFNDSMAIIDKRIAPDTITQLGYSLFVSDGVLGFQMADVLAPGSWNNFSGGPDLRDGHFHHVAVSVQRNSTSGGQLYVDGNLVSTFDPTVCPGDLSNTGPFRIGNFAVPGTPANFFGIIDEVSLYNRALTATEIQAIFNAGSGGKCVEATPPPPITNCVPPPAGLVGWWKGEDNGNDSAGTNNAAVLAGVAYAPAEVGQGFSLAGQANGINAPDAPALDFSSNQDFSIEAWIQPLASPGNFNDSMAIIDKRIAPDTITQLGYSLFVSDGVLGFQMADVLAPGSWNNFSGGPDLRDGHFHHVAVSVQRNSTSGGQFFIDGNLVSTFDPTVCPGDLSNTGPFRIGNDAVPGTQANFFGIIDEVSLYNRALTAAEVQAIFNAGSGGKCPPQPQPPVADATATIPLVISINNSNATVVLNGSLSSDPDGGSLQYYWFVNNAATASATGVVAVVVLPVGTNSITLSVSDGRASNQQSITVEVITTTQAVECLMDLVNTDLAQAQALAATLSAAINSVDRSNPTAAINQLQAFQNKVNAQIAPLNPTLAGTLVDQAQTIIDILASGGANAHGKMAATLDRANGRLHLNFSAPLGKIYIIEASTNLLDWQMIGVAKDQGDGTCGFDDPNAMQMSVRFYRIVAP